MYTLEETDLESPMVAQQVIDAIVAAGTSHHHLHHRQSFRRAASYKKIILELLYQARFILRTLCPPDLMAPFWIGIIDI